MVKLITVHGTFAGDEADEGDKWWQRGSPFFNELQKYVEEPLEVDPFHWSGTNSEKEREKAGRHLANKVQANESEPLVIGHSHGGSVIYWAFAHRLGGLGVRGAAVIGTPLIRFARSWNPIARFGVIDRVILISALLLILDGALAHSSWYFGTRYPDETMDNVLRLYAAAVGKEFTTISGGVIISFFVIREIIRSIRNFRFRSAGSQKLYESTIIIQSKYDEAINGLKSALLTKTPKVSITQVFASILSFVAIILLFLDAASQVPQVARFTDNSQRQMFVPGGFPGACSGTLSTGNRV